MPICCYCNYSLHLVTIVTNGVRNLVCQSCFNFNHDFNQFKKFTGKCAKCFEETKVARVLYPQNTNPINQCQKCVEFESAKSDDESEPPKSKADPQVSKAFILAAGDGNIHVLKLLLQSQSLDPTAGGNEAFHKAVMYKILDAVKLLIESRRIDPTSRNRVALKTAVTNGDIPMLKYLLNWIDPSLDMNEAFKQAIVSNKVECVKILLADPRIKTEARNSMLEMAIQLGSRKEIVQLFLADNCTNPNISALKCALECRERDMTTLLLTNKRVDPSAHKNYAIRTVSAYGWDDCVKLLLADKRVDPSAEDNEAIRTAAQHGTVSVVELLMKDSRVDPSAQDNYALHIAVSEGYVQTAKQLLQDSRVIPTDDDLQSAKRRGNHDVVKLLEERISKTKQPKGLFWIYAPGVAKVGNDCFVRIIGEQSNDKVPLPTEITPMLTVVITTTSGTITKKLDVVLKYVRLVPSPSGQGTAGLYEGTIKNCKAVVLS